MTLVMHSHDRELLIPISGRGPAVGDAVTACVTNRVITTVHPRDHDQQFLIAVGRVWSHLQGARDGPCMAHNRDGPGPPASREGPSRPSARAGPKPARCRDGPGIRGGPRRTKRPNQKAEAPGQVEGIELREYEKRMESKHLETRNRKQETRKRKP
jgi:hypothetical protein